jgi:uncharacterized protein (DUF362 family)
MGAVYEEFERQMEGWRRRYAGRPRRELIRLCLLALEREELVTVAYRETLIESRLRKMPLPEEVKQLIRHALVWTWKDEEMHAIYIRGAILRLGSRSLGLHAFARQLAGAVGGWAGSVRQHVRWSDAPLSRALATGITWAGIVAGQVPRDVRRYLKYGPFREFCLFNVDAERTAWLCWKRMEEIARVLPDLPPTLIEEFRRVQDDEERHERIFQILYDALDEADRLAPGETPDILAEKVGTVGENFLPRVRRAGRTAENPVGSGGPVWVFQGETPEEKLPLFRRLLEESGLRERLEARARSVGKPVADLRVVIKPSFMLGCSREDASTITDPALVQELARWLRDQGCRDIAVVERRNLYDEFYRNRTVQEVARYFGFSSPDYRVVDITEEQVPHSYFRGMAQYSVGRAWKEADFRVTFGKMSSHPAEMVFLTLGNLSGMGARCEEYMFPERQAHRDTALMMLLDEFPPHFALLDGYDWAPDGLLGFIRCPRPRTPRRLYAGLDAVALDQVAAHHLGEKDPRRCTMLRAAYHWFGEPAQPVRVVGVDEPVAGWRGPFHNEWSTLLSLLAYPVYEFGSGRGALFLPDMDEEAFPPLRRQSPLLRAARRGVRVLLDLGQGR